MRPELPPDYRPSDEEEFMNPFQQLRALSIEVPVISRDGIPT